jgi:hypothetical protein
MTSYKYPAIDTKFKSKLVNYENLHLCGGWSFEGFKQDDCIYRVLFGLKPMGALFKEDKEIIQRIVSGIDEEYLGIKYKIIKNAGCNKKYKELLVAVDSTFDNLFDMNSLILDYTAYFSFANFPYTFIQGIVMYLISLKDKSLSDFFDYDYANPESPLDLITTGLILGYPIETTASIIIRDFL